MFKAIQTGNCLNNEANQCESLHIHLIRRVHNIGLHLRAAL